MKKPQQLILIHDLLHHSIKLRYGFASTEVLSSGVHVEPFAGQSIHEVLKLMQWSSTHYSKEYITEFSGVRLSVPPATSDAELQLIYNYYQDQIQILRDQVG
jgi:hypothetical protein